jgi:hypothetical protein
VLLQVGSAGAPAYSQPSGTALRQNQLVSNGPCYALQGCAIRLDAGVTADVDAQQNNFGLPLSVDVNTVLWHKQNDTNLGFINASGALSPAPPALSPGVGAPGAVGGGLLGNPAAGSAVPVAAGTGAPASAGSGAPSSTGASAAPAPTGATPAPASSAGASATPQPGATHTPAAGPVVGSSSPVLSSGPAGGSTTYSPPCSFIPVPASVGSSISPGAFLSLFQPVTNIFSAWKYDNVTHGFTPLYFADPTAPVASITLKPGDIVSLCLTDTVQGPP